MILCSLYKPPQTLWWRVSDTREGHRLQQHLDSYCCGVLLPGQGPCIASAADPGLVRCSWHAAPHVRQWAGMPRRVTQRNLTQWPPGAMPQVSVTNRAEPCARPCRCGDLPQHNAEAGGNEQHPVRPYCAAKERVATTTVGCLHVETSVRGCYTPPILDHFPFDASVGRRSKAWNPCGRKIRSGMVWQLIILLAGSAAGVQEGGREPGTDCQGRQAGRNTFSTRAT